MEIQESEAGHDTRTGSNDVKEDPRYQIWRNKRSLNPNINESCSPKEYAIRGDMYRSFLDR